MQMIFFWDLQYLDIEGKEIRQTSDLELYEILPRENFLDGDDDFDISYEFKFLMLESKDPEKKKKSTMNKCYKWYRKRFTYPVGAQSCDVRYPTKGKRQYRRKFSDQSTAPIYSSEEENSTEFTKGSTFIFDRGKKHLCFILGDHPRQGQAQ